MQREDKLGDHLDAVRQLHGECKGNLVRVQEKLAEVGVEIGYSSLTAFCRRHDIGQPAKKRVGRYHFEPGEEMQHDTSPHKVKIGDSLCLVQCASLVLCYSRVIYAQVYVRWSRFECRAFLTEAITSFGGAASRCMIDNSSVIIGSGTGRDAVAGTTMAALGERFGFYFEAHAVGDANRSARVERPFDHIENNFYVGREFADIDDLNAQLLAWCERVNNRPKRSLPKTPLELLAAEGPQLRPLPAFIPEVYDLHARRVDVEGYVTLHSNRYSMPTALIGRTVEVRESMHRIRVFDGHRLVVEHSRRQPGARARITLPEHVHDGRDAQRLGPSEPEKLLRSVAPALGELVARLRKRHGGQALRAVRRLHKMYLDYPTEVLVNAVTDALAFDLHDLGRIDQMVLRRIRGDYFRLAVIEDRDDDDPQKRHLELGIETEPEPALGIETEPESEPAIETEPAPEPAPERTPNTAANGSTEPKDDDDG